MKGAATDLDLSQYTADAIDHYELVFGKDFISPGGRAMAAELIGQLGLKPGQRVLDVGCGVGGSAFLMAKDYGVQVDGIDLSKNMLERARRKRSVYGLDQQVELEYGDCLAIDRPGQYDAVYSRDVFLHIADKSRLFKVLLDALRPGGRILFTDYCCSQPPWSESFTDYVKQRGYTLHALADYVELVEQAGFETVQGVDFTNRFEQILEKDIENIRQLELSDSLRSELLDSWSAKLKRCREGEHRWGLIQGQKSAK